MIFGWLVVTSNNDSPTDLQAIETLSPAEQIEIKTLLLENEHGSGLVRYVDHDRALAVADKIFAERAELFQKLAQ